MMRWKMYSEIHQLKSIGLKRTQVSRKLNLNFKTVSKYWNMEPDEFAKLLEKRRAKKLDHYKDTILTWIKEYPDMSTAQIHDWLLEHFEDETIKDRTLRKYVSSIRTEYDIPKKNPQRQYQSVQDPPMGEQMQVDFGEIKLKNTHGGKTKIYGMGTVLSHSRYKYGTWRDKPLTTSVLINMLLRCFEYIGGVPKELVIDQDKLMTVSENYGDIIYTYEFEKFKQTMGFKVRLCRAGDPESKGRVEASIKYMKNNFAVHRLFTDINTFNQECIDWLERTANKKVHGTTKKVPAEVFVLEKQYLQPIPHTIVSEDIVTRTVRKDNTILYKSNRYTVPIGTFKPGLELQIKDENGYLKILDNKGDEIAKHRVSNKKGELIQNNNHLRKFDHKINEIFESILDFMGHTEETKAILTTIKKEKGRYIRDQFNLIKSLTQKYPKEVLIKAINYCYQNRLYSAVDVKDATIYFSESELVEKEFSNTKMPLPSHLKVKAEVRNISAYASIYGGDAR